MLPVEPFHRLRLILVAVGLTVITGCGGSRVAHCFSASDGSPAGTTDYIVYSNIKPGLSMDHHAPTVGRQDNATFRFPPGVKKISGDNLDPQRAPNHGTVSIGGETLRVEITLGNGKAHPLNGKYPIVDPLKDTSRNK
jgi:hypothetical protein